MVTQKSSDRRGWFQALSKAFRVAAAVSIVAAVYALMPACSSKRVDPRTLLPADPFVFLEAKDLGAALRALTENPDFKKHARSTPDLRPLDGVSVAIVITGFETKEARVSDEGSELRIQPHFVAVAETNAWNYQAVAFTEEKIGNFVNDIYGGEIKLEMLPRFGGQYFIWTAPDGRKAYALVTGSIVFFGNDETSIEKCVSVRDGKAESLAAKSAPADETAIASGFVSKDGISQLAGIFGIKIAHNAGDDADVQSAVAGIVPKLISNAVAGIRWNARRTETGIEDEFSIDLEPSIASVLKETMAPAATERIAAARSAASELPANPSSVTRYAFNDARIAWRSLLLTSQKQLDPAAGGILAQFSSLLFEPYGVRDPEGFLVAVSASSENSGIFTVRMSDEDDPAVLAPAVDETHILPTLAAKLALSNARHPQGASLFSSDDGDLDLLKSANAIGLGSRESLTSFRFGLGHASDALAIPAYEVLLTSSAPIVTMTDETAKRQKIVGLLSDPIVGAETQAVYSITETRFDQAGIKRKVTSEFGLIGSILEEFFADEATSEPTR